jgi:hypothetical protein
MLNIFGTQEVTVPKVIQNFGPQREETVQDSFRESGLNDGGTYHRTYPWRQDLW